MSHMSRRRDPPEPLVGGEVRPPPEVTVIRWVGRGSALVGLVLGQLASTALLFVTEVTSGSRLLSRVALAGYVAFSGVAWWLAARHRGLAVLVMAGGCAALLGLLLLADSLGA